MELPLVEGLFVPGCSGAVLCNIYTMASRLISAISDPRPRYQPEAKPRADIEGEGLILLILT